MKTVICEVSGLQEHEGQTFYQIWGTGEGNSLLEVCQDIIKKDPSKGKHFKSYPDGSCFNWGYTLFLAK